MSGIYLHIPFCKQACHYCDFHFSTSLKHKDSLLAALKKELRLRKAYFGEQTINTIYFGGGTPSLLSCLELESLLEVVYTYYRVVANPEITLEANPDDLDQSRLKTLAKSPINRLSIGIQSFFDADLKLMNRAHNAEEARICLEQASTYFNNFSIDLIYGIPEMSLSRWQENLDMALSFKVPHISAYALTVEPKTALAHFIQKGLIPPTDDTHAEQHFFALTDRLSAAGFVHYELSNFGKKGFFSQNNTAYWQGKKYLGIGPSAHSYDGLSRSWNIASNPKYIRALKHDRLALTTEWLSTTDRYNEYIMTGLRTLWGISLLEVETTFGLDYKKYLLQQADKHLEAGFLKLESIPNNAGHADRVLKATKKGKFLSDGIASDLFLLNLHR